MDRRALHSSSITSRASRAFGAGPGTQPPAWRNLLRSLSRLFRILSRQPLEEATTYLRTHGFIGKTRKETYKVQRQA